MGPFEMTVYIVLIVVVAGIVRKHIQARHGKGGGSEGQGHGDWGTGHHGYYSKTDLKPYLDKIDALEERIRVLEKIATDPSNRLSKEIDDLK